MNILFRLKITIQKFFNIPDSKKISCFETVFSFSSMILLFLSGFYISKVFTAYNNYLSIFSLFAYVSIVLSVSCLLYVGIRRKNLKAVIFSSMMSGFIIRFIYTSFTNENTRTHDISSRFGHYDYIKYIADNLALPNFNTTQAYHPPFHHILGAIFFKVGELLHLNEMVYIKAFQFFMVFLSCFAIFIIYKMFKILELNDTIIVTAITLISFHPALIMLSAKINNDNTLFFMTTLTLYFLFRWLSNKSYKNIIFLAVAFAFAVLTKVSAAHIIVIIAVIFLLVIIKNRDLYKFYLKQYLIFGLIATPLSLCYIIRNFILFGQPMNYVLNIGQFMWPTIYNTMYTPLGNLFTRPFNTGGLIGNNYFLDFFLKSVSFSEFEFAGLENIARIMNLLTVLLAIITTIFVIVSLFNKEKSYFYLKYIMILNIIIPLILIISLRFSNPVACSQDFRYVVQMLISTGFLLGYYVNILKNKKQYALVGIITMIIFLYCFLSGVFVLNMYSYFV